jgi:hypothetical protein
MTDIQELMARDPANCTREDIAEIVAYFRTARANFNLGNLMAGATKPRAASSSATKAVAATGKLDLSTLLDTKTKL